jgi:very-short-patch-repair endonuclease
MNGGGMSPAADWWRLGEVGQVTFLTGAAPDLLNIALDPLPAGAPAVVQFRPAFGATSQNQVENVLAEMDRAAVSLFPAWLPGADRLVGSQGLGVDAVRALAQDRAARSENFGPFLTDLAERALGGQRRDHAPFPAAVRAAGLARVIADAYGRRAAALLVDVPGGLSPAAERSLVATCEWLAHYGHLSVWLAGADLQVADWISTVTVELPEFIAQLDAESFDTEATSSESRSSPSALLTYPAVAGTPRHDSPAEQRLERALLGCRWAEGREWNRTFEWHLLAKPYRLDLFWPAVGVIVEVDGPEHRGRLQYADDRRRDVQLQLLGYDVLRFTNEQVLSDVGAVTTRIEQLLNLRRAAPRAA